MLPIATIAVLSIAGVTFAGPAERPFENEVIYQFMPIAWRDSDNDAQRFGDFNGMTASLDYLESLGVTMVWMTPIFPSPAYHGYQHGRADQLNPWFGTEPQFLNFVNQAHARGIKVFIDNVVYGISHTSEWHQSAYNNAASPYDSWLAFTNAANTTYQGSVYTTWSGSSVGFIHWDHNNANPQSLVTDWAQKWLDPNNDGDPSDGIDGYRLDHVWNTYPSGPNGWGYNIDSFWIPWKTSLQSVNPNVLTFAEQADWGTTGSNLMAAFDATMTKPWEFAVRDTLTSETSNSVYSQTAATLAQLPAGKTFLGIIGDHDVDRLTSIIGGSLTKAKAAAAILMTSPFPPMIYFGDEIGMRGTKGNWGTDANDIPMREPFKWNAVAGPPMSNYFVLNASAYNARVSQNNDGRSVEEQDGVPGSLLEAYKQLITMRKTHPALRHGSYVPITNSSNRNWAFLRHAEGEETLFVVIRVRSASGSATFDLSNTTIPGGSTTPVDLINGQSLANITDANKFAYSITMPAYGYKILQVNLAPVAPPPNEIDGLELPDSLGPFSIRTTQNNATALGDNLSELNQLFVRPTAGGLRIGISGNLTTDGTGLCLFIDSRAGGQNVLNFSGYTPPPGGPNALTGTRLDAGFEPDEMIFINTAGGTIYVDQFTLLPGGITKLYKGNGTINDGDGNLAGGSNANGMQVAMNNSNTLGVTGASAANASTARHGFDMLIPFQDIGVAGLTGGDVKIAAFIVKTSGEVTNQWLPGLGGGYANLGLAPNLTTISQDQFVTAQLALIADIDADQDVDLLDADALVGVLLDQPSDPSHPSRSDLNHDGIVDARDIAAMTEVLLFD
jgi:glycosidase